MSWLETIRRRIRHHADQEGATPPSFPTRPPFPTLSTFFGIAAVMIVVWLLASGLPHLLSADDRPVNNIDTGATK
ncbi:hypothetical protein [Mesorhizobium sp.]|uniref:hypothetical protein n=1 Tax=Mesorhizobium sp. TaxID=1871066 RepID=UPI000FE8AD0F|nr:hypothetical protein [Mesorhizobium sp.]RWK41913.1 MAG: hypothetical protein EOR46_14135 [Mesorhizobium sp.]RWK66689.1 MAG: hypothetical protein EOR54_23065 [Mesorhizobium sp.]RWK75331.1 MAG: hypothetical protein EOR50_17520 [Mesorhizobium sp.]RWK78028.1 MAG: hypothetical protein EOR51_24935 [Mesorhizobium sp.]RWL02539.1 MAG: hypothetical protein EOR55_21795 [Mesorhizobium sp.]